MDDVQAILGELSSNCVIGVVYADIDMRLTKRAL